MTNKNRFLNHAKATRRDLSAQYKIESNVEIAGSYTGEYIPLSIQEERELIEKCQDNDGNSIWIFFKSKVGLIRMFINKWRLVTDTVSVDDLLHESFFAFKKTIDRFDLTKENCFNTYFRWELYQTLRNYHFKYKSAMNDNSYNKSIKEGVFVNEINDSGEFISLLTSATMFTKKVDFERYDKLTDKQKLYSDLYFNKGYTLREISETYGISNQAVDISLKLSKDKLRKQIRDKEVYTTIEY